jgi:hypothetical protein
MPTLNIFTTATPRPDMHKVTAIKAVDKLLSFGPPDKIEWYINVDCPSMFTEQDRSNTVDNFLSFSKPGLKTHIMADHQSAHFGAAARRLYTSCEPSGKDNIFLWLEDDWVLREDNDFFMLLYRFFSFEYNFFLCSIATYVTGNPLFFKQDFFEIIKRKYNSTAQNIDPELMLFEGVMEKFHTNNPRIAPPNSFHKQYFFDIGRQWRAERNIHKLDKYHTHLKGDTWIQ